MYGEFNMVFEQYALPVFGLSENPRLQPTRPVERIREISKKPEYWTTDQVVSLLKLNSAYPLHKAKRNREAYRSDRYIAVPAGRNRWELFKRCSA
jgi:hypothetical protein